MATWYYKNGEQESAPHSDQELRRAVQSGLITSATMVRQGENGTWFNAAQIPGLLIQPTIPSSPTFQGVAPQAGLQKPTYNPGAVGFSKNRVTAILFALFLGGLGIQRLYLGTWGWSIVAIGTCLLGGYVISIIDIIRWIQMSDEEFHARYHHPQPFLW